MNGLRRCVRLAAAVAALMAGWVPARACPGEGPLSVLVPYAAGGSVDVTTRIVAKAVAMRLKRTVLVVNVPGASGVIAVRQLLGMARDGCTLLAGTINTVVLVPLQNRQAGYAMRDLVPVGRIGATGLLFAASPQSGLNDMAALREAVRSARVIRAGHPGQDSVQALALTALETRLNTSFVLVPYSGAGPMVNDLAGGHIDIAALAKPAALPLFKRSAVQPLGLSFGPEDGLPAMWSGWFAARGVPLAALQDTRRGLAESLGEPQVLAALNELGIDVERSEAAAFAAEVEASARGVQQLLAAPARAAAAASSARR